MSINLNITALTPSSPSLDIMKGHKIKIKFILYLDTYIVFIMHNALSSTLGRYHLPNIKKKEKDKK
jgi:hypothetical protein